MAKVTYSAGIDSVSGALSKPSKSGQHSCSAFADQPSAISCQPSASTPWEGLKVRFDG